MQKGTKQSDESRKKMSESRKGKPLSEAHKAALSKAYWMRNQKGTEQE